jgi:hypothetical protein
MREATMGVLLDSIGNRTPAVDPADQPARKKRRGNADAVTMAAVGAKEQELTVGCPLLLTK